MTFTYNEWEDVSVIIPVFNNKETLSRAVRSATNQIVKPVEIIIVDGGSTDGSFEEAERLANIEGGIVPITVYKKLFKTAGAARNFAISQAKGELLAFLDADDEWMPTKISRSLEEMRKTNATLVAHDVIHKYPTGRKIYIESSKHFDKEKPNAHTQLYLHDYINTSTVLVKASAVKNAGGFMNMQTHASEYSLWLSILAQKETSFHLFKGALTTYHITKNSLSSQIWPHFKGHEEAAITHSRHSAKNTFIPSICLASYRILLVCLDVCVRTLRAAQIEKFAQALLRTPYALLKVLLLSPFSGLKKPKKSKTEEQSTK